jgi:hypothetical protein
VYGCCRSGVLFYLLCYDGLAYACGGQGDLCGGGNLLCGVGYLFGKFTADLGWIRGGVLWLGEGDLELWMSINVRIPAKCCIIFGLQSVRGS